MSLFRVSEPLKIKLPNAEIEYTPAFFNLEESSRLFEAIYHETNWIEEDIRVYGKVYKQPRLTAFFASNHKAYGYSNISMSPQPFSPIVNAMRLKIEKKTKMTFSSCLLNLYRNGQDSNGWHSDDEKMLKKNGEIASVTLGAARKFSFKHKETKQKVDVLLESGSLLVMKDTTQTHWLHRLPPTKKVNSPRINLTFRTIEL